MSFVARYAGAEYIPCRVIPPFQGAAATCPMGCQHTSTARTPPTTSFLHARVFTVSVMWTHKDQRGSIHTIHPREPSYIIGVRLCQAAAAQFSLSAGRLPVDDRGHQFNARQNTEAFGERFPDALFRAGLVRGRGNRDNWPQAIYDLPFTIYDLCQRRVAMTANRQS